MKTKFGTAKLQKSGYYVITSKKEGNCGKKLHRLVFEDYHNCKLDKNDVIHHIDFDKTNNHPTNLICVSKKAHSILHVNKNSSGYFRVRKYKKNKYKDNFLWKYTYNENGKQKFISSTSIDTLEVKVRAKKLPWIKLNN